jgi:hypothetical protein
MFKPRTQNFKVKVMLIKLEAAGNKVSTRCHASLTIGISLFIQTEMSSISKSSPS